MYPPVAQSSPATVSCPISLEVCPPLSEEIQAWRCQLAQSSSLCLAPFVDMLNHSPRVITHPVCGVDSSGSPCFALFQSCSLLPRQTVSISYGLLGSSALGRSGNRSVPLSLVPKVCRYGFCIDIQPAIESICAQTQVPRRCAEHGRPCSIQLPQQDSDAFSQVRHESLAVTLDWCLSHLPDRARIESRLPWLDRVLSRCGVSGQQLVIECGGFDSNSTIVLNCLARMSLSEELPDTRTFSSWLLDLDSVLSESCCWNADQQSVPGLELQRTLLASLAKMIEQSPAPTQYPFSSWFQCSKLVVHSALAISDFALRQLGS